ncbi:MAG: hypothetical protein HY860_01615 [Chlamydiales bacterium]|nr:hypothetical protein [Chlamydiales bacterium]
MFSVTEALVFNPINTLSQPQRSCAESELLTRIIGVSASVFAVIDLAMNLVGIVGVSAYIATKMICCCCDAQDCQLLCDLIGNVFKFTILTLIGSVFGVMFPQCISITYIGNNIGEEVDLADPVVIDEQKEQEAFLHLAALAQAVQDGDEVSPFPHLRDFFASASTGTQMRFIDMFSEGSIPEYAKVRKELADVVFQPKSLADHDVKWLSNLEIEEAATKLASTARLTQTLAAKNIPWTDNFHKGYFFHATRSEDNMQGILGKGKIEVRHQGTYRGAFVSTVPEMAMYGNYVFVLRESIAHNSSLTIASNTSDSSYWAGFSQGIPIDPSTLAYIMVGGSDVDCASLQARCKTWAGWDIPVVSYQDMEEHLEELKTIGRGIPKSWPKPTS